MTTHYLEMNKETKDFIEEHISDDIRRLALRKASDGVDLRFALQQIDGRQRARTKLPTLAANPDILFPAHLSLEQCSSEATARYKREILEALASAPTSEASASDKTVPRLPSTLIDLTGGFGIDFIALSPLFNRAVYVERDSTLCDIVSQNLRTLYQDPHSPAAPTLTTICADAETILSASPLSPTPHPASTLFFLDPARRSSTGARTFAISDCTPDVMALMPQLKTQGSLLMLKLSPMLDWHKAVDDIQQCDADVMQV
ncbi:MAG: SAM-dependent methyltransferase, partial [Bacteroidaceae bacterium]|nr:SAM-dependent methyltransferase [Bacteroidaceae bacterium]